MIPWTAFLISSFVFSVIAISVAINALIEVKALQRSTHKVQFFNPVTQEFSKLTGEQAAELQKEDFDNL